MCRHFDDHLMSAHTHEKKNGNRQNHQKIELKRNIRVLIIGPMRLISRSIVPTNWSATIDSYVSINSMGKEQNKTYETMRYKRGTFFSSEAKHAIQKPIYIKFIINIIIPTGFSVQFIRCDEQSLCQAMSFVLDPMQITIAKCKTLTWFLTTARNEYTH